MWKPTGYARSWTSATAAALLLSGCAVSGNFGTETQAEWCRALLENQPSASVDDDPQTQEDVADIGEVIWILCRRYL